MKALIKIIIGLVFLLTLSPLAYSQETEPENLSFFLSFVPNIQFAPLYVAIEQGYYTDENLSIVIEHGDENVGLERIAANDLKYGMISGEQVILGRAAERPVKYVYEWFQEYPVGIVIASTIDYNEPADLVGQPVGIPGRFGASYAAFTAFLSANDLTEMDVDVREIGYNAPDIFCAGNVKAAAIYMNNEPVQIQNRIDVGECADVESITVVAIDQYADLVSNGIVTNDITVEENPDQVRAVVRAFDRGLQATINNPAQAYLISTKYVENLSLSDDLRAALESAAEEQEAFLADDPTAGEIAESREDLLATLLEDFSADELLQFHVLLVSIDLWSAERLGETDPESWEVTAQALEALDMVSTVTDLESAYTNEFLPEED